MPWNVMLFPLLGGFVGLDWCLFTRLRNQRIDGYRLLLEAAFAAAWLTVIAYGLTWWVTSHTTALGPALVNWWSSLAPPMVPFLGTALVSFILGPALAIVINQFVDRDFAKYVAVRKVGNSLLALLYDAATQGDVVQLILSNGIVYTAQVLASPDLKPETHVVVLPVLTGFEKDAQITYTNKKAWWTYSDRRWAEVIIPINDIDRAKKVETLDASNVEY
jgi:hypothetical protein